MLVIRPEEPPWQKQTLEGTVTLSTFMGSYQYYQVMVNMGDSDYGLQSCKPQDIRGGGRHIWISIPRGLHPVDALVQ